MNPLKRFTFVLGDYNRKGRAESLFGVDAALARELVRRCRLSARKGTTPDVTPWLALCDLAEEHGDTTMTVVRRWVVEAVTVPLKKDF